MFFIVIMCLLDNEKTGFLKIVKNGVMFLQINSSFHRLKKKKKKLNNKINETN